MEQAFLAIGLIFEPEMRPLRTMAVYLKSRKGYSQELIDNWEKIIESQYQIFHSSNLLSETVDLKLPTGRNEALGLGQMKRFFLNWLWFSPYRIVRSAHLNQKYADALDTSPNQLRGLLARNYGVELSLNWYLKHYRNVRNSALWTMIAMLSPTALDAGRLQYQLESQSFKNIDAVSIDRSKDLVFHEKQDLMNALGKELAKVSSQKNLTSDEQQFVIEMSEALKK